MDLQFVGHATILLDVGGTRILTDPFLRRRLGPLERHGPIPDPARLRDVDLVVISHAHPDHFDPWSLAALPGRPTVIVPRGLGRAARESVAGEVVELSVGDHATVGGTSVEAVEARHWTTPGGPPARPQGYLLRVHGGSRIWFAGDTGAFPGLADLGGRVDVALVPVWTWGPHLGPGHLGPRSAAEVVAGIGARVAIPMHWGTLYPRRLHRVLPAPLMQPGDRFAAHLRRFGPRVGVRVLRPGETSTVDVNGDSA